MLLEAEGFPRMDPTFHCPEAYRITSYNVCYTKLLRTTKELDAELNQLISKSVVSDEVVDILEAVGLQKPNIAILSDEFLEHVRGLKQKNLAVELLRRLLQGKVKAVSRTSIVQSKKFSEMLEEAIRKYNNRTIETTQVIEELISYNFV